MGTPAAGREALAQPDEARIKSDLRWLERSGAVLLPCTAPGFPPQLAELPDAPLALFLRGDPATLLLPQLAVVGSRSPTAAGQRIAQELAQDWATPASPSPAGSRAASTPLRTTARWPLRRPTIAVCGTGLDHCYPAAEPALAERIAARQGALVSEFLPGTGPRAGRTSPAATGSSRPRAGHASWSRPPPAAGR